ncbi:MAG: hypothetical protein QXL15_01910 [Candidatus Korarchaeota archaeon]
MEFVIVPLNNNTWVPLLLNPNDKEEVWFYMPRNILLDDKIFQNFFYERIYSNPIIRGIIKQAKSVRFEPHSFLDRLEKEVKSGSSYADIIKICEKFAMSKKILDFYNFAKSYERKKESVENFRPKLPKLKEIYDETKIKLEENALEKYEEKIIY